LEKGILTLNPLGEIGEVPPGLKGTPLPPKDFSFLKGGPIYIPLERARPVFQKISPGGEKVTIEGEEGGLPKEKIDLRVVFS